MVAGFNQASDFSLRGCLKIVWIYSGRTCQAGFFDPFRKVEPLFASNDQKI
ncbi:hypothetical protein NMYAN_30192 [Nitrosomonas nitrosa]|uniref:Uncharacterized protein n=1 Tax=Nitrosomonas nitrosa TaxID=52442 RepID=A0A8H8Z2B8_9PROT|nr:hypothetical protein NMYAN_30192 [Nitrosomonas nitrosa]